MHTHSTVSDGTQPPAELMTAARAAKIDVMALTDHDSTAGWVEASNAARGEGVVLIPGMEVTCRTSEGISVHVLSYLHDPANSELLNEISKSREARLVRAEKMVDRLAADYPITWEHVLEHLAPGATVGRPHIADALVRLNVVETRSEAFAHILNGRSSYFVSHYAPNPALAVELIRKAGGVPVFAHPAASLRGRVVTEHTMNEMIDAGLAGLEIDHRDNSDEGKEKLRGIADEHGLLVTGSSDYHGAGKPNLLGENLTSADVLAHIEELGTGTTPIR
nr:PHP domain-containing protein [Arthrobacter roseus]